MLSIGKIKFLDSGDLLFTEGEPISHLCIILLGKVVLTKAYNPFKSYGLPGESLGE
jgi:CRP-like cAMP-binding protein